MTDISVVIPALDEARKIRKDVESAAAFFRDSGLRGEVIVVDDGSSDGTDTAAREASVPAGMELKVIRLEKNRGKGFAVRTGVMASQGDVVLFADSGSCVPYADALPQIRRIRAGELDVALGSRRHPQTVIHRDRPWRRRFLHEPCFESLVGAELAGQKLQRHPSSQAFVFGKVDLTHSTLTDLLEDLVVRDPSVHLYHETPRYA